MGMLPQEGEVWVRSEDGKRVEIVKAPRGMWDRVRLRWPNGRTTRKLMHYFSWEFEASHE